MWTATAWSQLRCETWAAKSSTSNNPSGFFEAIKADELKCNNRSLTTGHQSINLEVFMAKRSKRQKGAQVGGRGMMQQLQQLQEQMLQAQNALADETVEATVGGGVVKVVATGDQKIVSIEIAPEILEDADVEMLQDMILTAVNSALEKSQELAAERLGPLAGGMPF
jgi:DNA-binding YbaB/EbfC family protein